MLHIKSFSSIGKKWLPSIFSKRKLAFPESKSLTSGESVEASDANGWVRITRTAEFNTTVPNNQDLYIRFTGDDVSGSGSRDEFAIDNIRLIEAD